MYLLGKCLDKKYKKLYLTLEQNFANLKGMVMQDCSATDSDIFTLCERFVLRFEKRFLVPREIHFSMLSMPPPFWQVVPSLLWETFGLTLLEATASGNAMVGFNVRYGNQLFIRDKENGYMVDLDYERLDEAGYVDSRVEELADKIVNLFSDSGRLSKMQKKSYEIASEF